LSTDDTGRRKMDTLDYWRLCDALNVIQAALLVVGSDPSNEANSVEHKHVDDRPQGYEAAKTAISNALRRKTIAGEAQPLFEYDTNGNIRGEVIGAIDLEKSLVEVAALRTWLAARGVKSGFFFPEAGSIPDYLDPRHPRYAPKLAAAVQAWLASEQEAAATGKSPKQALIKWLRVHAVEFGLTDDDGKPNETGIEEAAKVANWDTKGGAPRAPGND
jgi:hypothetical protein